MCVCILTYVGIEMKNDVCAHIVENEKGSEKVNTKRWTQSTIKQSIKPGLVIWLLRWDFSG